MRRQGSSPIHDGIGPAKDCSPRFFDGKTPALHDQLLFQNFGTEAAIIPVALTFQAAFENIVTIRELVSEELGLQQPPRWKQGVLSFHYGQRSDPP